MLKVNKTGTLLFAVSDSEYEAVQFLVPSSLSQLTPTCGSRPNLSVPLLTVNVKSLLALFSRDAFCTLGLRRSSVKRLV